MKRLYLVAIFFALFLSTVAKADYVYGAETTIKRVATFASGSVAGDIIISVDNTVAGCEAGYYVGVNALGKDESLSIALSAFHAGSKVKINGLDTPRWEGSSSNYCKIESLHIIK
ncbi:MAG: hypothetical protein HWE27_10590 [Gammaproteobacteria bacterium]|nr:hypothetical protein [Gammaproteobacteria bacterium]